MASAEEQQLFQFKSKQKACNNYTVQISGQCFKNESQQMNNK